MIKHLKVIHSSAIRFITYTKHFWPLVGLIVLWLFLALTNTVHDKYPDEFDNVLGGKYILEGKLIYKDFFTHHGPFAYMLSSVVLLFANGSFVNFRIVYALFLVIYFVALFIYFQRKSSLLGNLFLAIATLYFFGATYFWGHMVLADNLAALTMTPVYFLLLGHLLFKTLFHRHDLFFVSVLLAVAVLSSITYLYAAALLYAALLFVWWRQQQNTKAIGQAVLIYALPFIVWLLYLVLTSSLIDFYQQTIVFNSKYYIYNYPRAEGSTFINPIRLAIVIIESFIQNIHPLLTNIRNVDFFYPLNTTMIISNVVIIIMICIRRQYAWAVGLFILLAFINARSNPFESGERDYQSAVYVLFSFVNTILALYIVQQELKSTKVQPTVTLVSKALFIFLLTFSFFSGLFLFRKWSDKTYEKYMGTYPLIYDRPTLAPIINAVVEKDDYMWIGPFDFEDLFYAKGRLPSKYHILIPAMSKNGMDKQLLADIQATQPKIIVFDWHLFILGNAPIDFAPDFVDYLNNNYIKLKEYTEDGYQYSSVESITLRRNVEEKLYINPDYKDEVISDLLKANIIKRIPIK